MFIILPKGMIGWSDDVRMFISRRLKRRRSEVYSRSIISEVCDIIYTPLFDGVTGVQQQQLLYFSRCSFESGHNRRLRLIS